MLLSPAAVANLPLCVFPVRASVSLLHHLFALFATVHCHPGALLSVAWQCPSRRASHTTPLPARGRVRSQSILLLPARGRVRSQSNVLSRSSGRVRSQPVSLCHSRGRLVHPTPPYSSSLMGVVFLSPQRQVCSPPSPKIEVSSPEARVRSQYPSSSSIKEEGTPKLFLPQGRVVPNPSYSATPEGD